MSASLVSRTLVRTRPSAWSRSIHSTAPARSGHGPYHHLPFAWPGEKKASFAIKMGAFLGLGFAIPFIAGAYQLNKSKGAA